LISIGAAIKTGAVLESRCQGKLIPPWIVAKEQSPEKLEIGENEARPKIRDYLPL
jgi:hypothetical protein